MTNQQVADEINRTKPNFKQFWEDVNKYDRGSTFTPHSNPAITLFQIELIELYYRLHYQRYMGSTLSGSLNTALRSIAYTGLIDFHWRIDDDITSKSGDYHNLILAYVTDLKQYLNPYLRKRLGFTATKAKDIKSIKDDAFSIELLKAALGKRKIPSTEAIEYFNQFHRFTPVNRDTYMDIITQHCTAPSQKFQRAIADSSIYGASFNSKQANPKYISLDRSHVRHNRNHMYPVTSALLDERDSDYTPFTCGVPRKPTPTKDEVSALVSILFIIASSNADRKDYIIQCLHDHLSHPDYGTLYTDALRNFEAYSNSVLSTIKDL